MKIAAIIPARYNSTRFRGKPLVKIKGITMIERVYRKVEKCRKFADIIIATDDERILDEVQRFGGNGALTSDRHHSGTDRLWEVLASRDFAAAVNIQGDEPLLPEKLIGDLFDELETGRHQVVTAAYFNTAADDFFSENVVKVVFDKNGRALYFSRSPVPFIRGADFTGFFQHIGIYGYLRNTVEAFINFPPSRLENSERLEQLRFLENGVPIKIIISAERSIGVDVPADIEKIEKLLAAGGE
ncbi:MAG: 3-deoxy-manno-octulosonate cytidylyltransferase [Candidatus Aminicenantes bacterium]|nr:3-deoxy-manno-octulosonate cytidylyltransferase [Candidatus Aminicenantes bacterium]